MLTGQHALGSAVNWIQVERTKKNRPCYGAFSLRRWRLHFGDCKAIVCVVSVTFSSVFRLWIGNGFGSNPKKKKKQQLRKRRFMSKGMSPLRYFSFSFSPFLSLPRPRYTQLFPSIFITFHFRVSISLLFSFRSCVILWMGECRRQPHRSLSCLFERHPAHF